MSDSNGRTENTEKILLWGLVFCHYNGRTVVNPVLSSFYRPPFSSLSIAFRWVARIRGHRLRLSSASG